MAEGWGVPEPLRTAVPLPVRGDAPLLARAVAAGYEGAAALYEPFDVPSGIPAAVARFAAAAAAPESVQTLLADACGDVRQRVNALLREG